MQWFNQLKAKIMRKSYISPASETMVVNSVNTICTASGTRTNVVVNLNEHFDAEGNFN